MSAPKLPGGPTQDEILAVTLFRIGIRPGDLVLDCGCGTGTIAIAAARVAGRVIAVDDRPEAIRFARRTAKKEGIENVEFHLREIHEFLKSDHRVFDCAIVGGTRGLSRFLPVLTDRVCRSIAVHAVLISTINTAVNGMKELGTFEEAVQIQVSRSHEIAGGIMFRPIDPVTIIIGRGRAC